VASRADAERLLPQLYVKRQDLRERRAALQSSLKQETHRWRDRAQLGALVAAIVFLLALTQAPLALALPTAALLFGAGLVAARKFPQIVATATEGQRRELAQIERHITDVDRRIAEAQRLATS
jgi:hypothetical protein